MMAELHMLTVNFPLPCAVKWQCSMCWPAITVGTKTTKRFAVFLLQFRLTPKPWEMRLLGLKNAASSCAAQWARYKLPTIERLTLLPKIMGWFQAMLHLNVSFWQAGWHCDI